VKDARLKCIENILILSGDHLYRINYVDFVQVSSLFQADALVSGLFLTA
jgi:ADP-glucose pyrophosphorylase